MVKYLLNLLLIFLISSSFAFAKDNDADAKLKQEFGEDLTHAPFFLRFAFYKEYHKDWKETYYSEREYFLMDYEKNLAAQEKEDKEEARAEADKEKDRLLEKKEELRKERDRLRAQIAEEKSEKQEDIDRQKAFNAVINGQERELEEMQREITQER